MAKDEGAARDFVIAYLERARDNKLKIYEKAYSNQSGEVGKELRDRHFENIRKEFEEASNLDKVWVIKIYGIGEVIETEYA